MDLAVSCCSPGVANACAMRVCDAFVDGGLVADFLQHKGPVRAQCM